MMAIATPDGYFRELNPAWTRTLGWDGSELTSRPYADFVHPDDHGRTGQQATQLVDGVPVTAFRNRYRTKAGGWKWLEWRAVPDTETGHIYAAARDVTDAVELQDRLEARERMVSRMFAEQVRVRDDERQLVASDLHDSTVQHLVAAIMFLEACDMPEDDPTEAALERELRLALDSTRRVMQGLDPLELGEAELETAVVEHVRLVGQHYDLQVELEVELDEEPEATIAGVAYRIVREAVTNAGKHSRGTRLAVSVRTIDGLLELRVDDDGSSKGRSTERSGGGFGMAMMRERAAAAGGVLQVDFTADGTRLSASLPLRRAESAGIDASVLDGKVTGS